MGEMGFKMCICSQRELLPPNPPTRAVQHHSRRLRTAFLCGFVGNTIQATMSTLTTIGDFTAFCSEAYDTEVCAVNHSYRLRLFIELIAACGASSCFLVYFIQCRVRKRRAWASLESRGDASWASQFYKCCAGYVRNLLDQEMQVVKSIEPTASDLMPSVELGEKPQSSQTGTTQVSNRDIGILIHKSPPTPKKPTKFVKLDNTVRVYSPRPKAMKLLWLAACLLHCLEMWCVWQIKGRVSESLRWWGLTGCAATAFMWVLGVTLTHFGHTQGRQWLRNILLYCHVPPHTQVAFFCAGLCATIGCYGPYLTSHRLYLDSPSSILWSWCASLAIFCQFVIISYCLKQRPDLAAMLGGVAGTSVLISQSIQYLTTLSLNESNVPISSLLRLCHPLGHGIPILAYVGGLMSMFGAASTMTLSSTCFGAVSLLLANGTYGLVLALGGQMTLSRVDSIARCVPLLLLAWVISRPELFFSSKLQQVLAQQMDMTKNWSLTRSQLEGRLISISDIQTTPRRPSSARLLRRRTGHQPVRSASAPFLGQGSLSME
eukprot:Blabericola_migrator_1__2486@NODE_16_length_23467_cov_90_205256_g13_i0_p6_GENE_NODE_16_length_23467_cov_90_205256_g13_i0NODE_16_length_23467_cov_90_205256_g13_i0_p6_ORF_typecomplete_len546_score27_13UPF0060/PF02694_15/9_9UPF0060/PF02694_15/0_43UPF0060/PF02694_15/6_5e03_NODE_16_length_23467_cov_90_205256_g13_i01819619833